MKNSRNERLSEHLLNVDEEILANAYEIDSSEKLQRYIKTKNEKNKPFYVTHTFRRATTFAASLILIVGIALYVPELLSSDANKIPYVVADGNDTYGLELEDLKSRDEKYISPSLQEKMQAYRGTNAVYRVIVEIIITAEDYDEFTVNDEELLLLEEQEDAAFEAYVKALDSLRGVSDEAKRTEIVNEINEKEKIARDLQQRCSELREKLIAEYCGNIVKCRLEYATQLSKTAPVLITDESGVFIYAAYKSKYAYFMDLTAEDINHLSEKGGYMFRLASSPKDIIPGIEAE